MSGYHSSSKNRQAFFLFALGFLMLFGLGTFWPLLIVIPGALMVMFSRTARAASPMAIPGMLTLGTGLLLQFQNITGYWDSWIYAWTLYGVFLGMGLTMMGESLEEREIIKVGRMMTRASLLIFVLSGSFVILITTSLFRLILVVALFSAGAYMLFKHSDNQPIYGLKPKRSDASVEENIQRMQHETYVA